MQLRIRSGLLAMALLLTACSREGGPELPAAAAGKHYYHFADGYRCKTFSPDPAGIPSWVDHLEVRGSQVMQWGSRCQDAAAPLPTADMTRLRFAPDAASVEWNGKTYVTVADPVAEAERKAG